MTRLLLLAMIVLFPASALADEGDAFAAGQRWSCVTDQGAEAYLDVLGVEGEAVSFSWGVLNPDTNELTRLCNKRDALSAGEMGEFCQLLGEEFSEGHVMLRDGCASDAAQ